MHIDYFFAFSNSQKGEEDFLVFGIPYDQTQSFKSGSRFAPNAIREASWNLESYSVYFDYDLELARIHDAGNVNVDGNFDRVVKNVSELLSEVNSVPIALGGEHTITYAVLRNFEEVCYIAFDAHLDLRDEFDDNPFSHACVTRRIHELGFDVILVGVRSGTEEEFRFAREKGIFFFHPWRDFGEVVETVRKIVGDRDIYLSIDMDAFDPAFAPGVSTPEPFGLNPIVMLKFFEEFSDRIVGLDVVEVVPDSERVTQTLAAKLIIEFIASRCKRK